MLDATCLLYKLGEGGERGLIGVESSTDGGGGGEYTGSGGGCIIGESVL